MTLNEIQQKLKVSKSHRNTFGNYNYRNAEDILEAVKPMLGDSTLLLSDDVVQIGDRYYVKATARFIASPGKHKYVCEISKYLKGETTLSEMPPCTCDLSNVKDVSVTAYARESEEKKGMDSAQITGAASSYARKYALNGLFLIDDTKDADSDEEKQVETASKEEAEINERFKRI